MSILPEFLLNAYDAICTTDLVKHKDISIQNIQTFVSLLNQSIPKKYTAEYTIYLFNRTKYKVNRWKFIKDIHDSPYKSMVLWTNYKEILKHFDLVQQFYLKWDKELNQYVGDMYDPSKSSKEEVHTSSKKEGNPDPIAESKKETKDHDSNDSNDSNDQQKIEEYMDDQDRLMLYMQQKKKELEERNKKM